MIGESFSAGPSGGADHAAETDRPEGRILVGEYIGLDVAEARLGSGRDGVVKGLDDLFLERGCARTTASRSASVNSENAMPSASISTPAVTSAMTGCMKLRNAGCRVQRDRGPDRLDVALGDAMAAQEIAGDVGAVHLEALIRAGVLRGEAHVVKHGTGIKQLAIKAETAALAGERAPEIDAARVMEQ